MAENDSRISELLVELVGNKLSALFRSLTVMASSL